MQNFFAGFFQLGYVTRNLDQAIETYRRKFGDVDFLVFDPEPIDGVAPATKRLGLAYIDDIMTELIEPDPAQKTIYDDVIPEDPGTIRFHHFGYLIEDHSAMLSRLKQMGYSISVEGSIPGFLDYSYADTRADLGHFSEFIRLDEGGKAFFGNVPRLTTR